MIQAGNYFKYDFTSENDGLASNKKIKRVSFTEQILQILLQRILTGELKPGDRIKELQVANEMETSQAPVREAIRALEAMGYVEHKPHTGARVKAFSIKEMYEAFRVREALELFSIEIGIEALIKNVNKFKSIQTNLENTVEHNDIKEYSRIDHEFHRLIISLSENETMIKIWDSLQIQSRVERALRGFQIPIGQMIKYHPPIIKAIAEGNAKGARNELRAHYDFAFRYFSDYR